MQKLARKKAGRLQKHHSSFLRVEPFFRIKSDAAGPCLAPPGMITNKLEAFGELEGLVQNPCEPGRLKVVQMGDH